MENRSIAALNTRKKEVILRLEFKCKDYSGPWASRTRHSNFDCKFDITKAPSDMQKASEIISQIKLNY
jgi:hypothetical protein